MGEGWIFLNTFRASLFNDDLSNEPNFGRIHLAGQYHEIFCFWFFAPSPRVSHYDRFKFFRKFAEIFAAQG
jgi:hypothetical protein